MTLVAAVIGAYFAAPRPSVQVSQFQMLVDVARHRATFHLRLNNAGTADVEVRMVSLGKPLNQMFPSWRGETLFPAPGWRSLAALEGFSVSAATPLDAEDFLLARFGLDATVVFDSRPAGWLGLLIVNPDFIRSDVDGVRRTAICESPSVFHAFRDRLPPETQAPVSARSVLDVRASYTHDPTPGTSRAQNNNPPRKRVWRRPTIVTGPHHESRNDQ